MRWKASCRSVAPRAGLAEALDRVVEAPLDGRHEELLLGAEEAEQVGLRDAHVARR